MGSDIHATAVIYPGAELGEGVEVGPYVTIGPEARIGDRTRLLSSCHILGRTTIGKDCVVSPSAVLGGFPQDMHYKGEDTELILGDRNRIGEFVTMHRGTASGGGKTVMGDDCMMMSYSHVGHDCRIGNHVVIVNASHLGGHVHVEDRATISGGCLIHQFVTVGTLAFLAPTSFLCQDAPPYMIVEALPAAAKIRLVPNHVGLTRNGVPKKSVAALRRACGILFHRGDATTMSEAIDRLAEEGIADDEYVGNLIRHVRDSLASRKRRALEQKRK